MAFLYQYLQLLPFTNTSSERSFNSSGDFFKIGHIKHLTDLDAELAVHGGHHSVIPSETC